MHQMNRQPEPLQDDDRQLLLSDLLALLWRRRGLIVLFSLIAIVATAIALLFIEPKYRISVTVVEKQDETTQNAGFSLSAGLSSISSSLLGGRPTLSINFQQFLDLLTEPGMLEQLPNRDAVLHTIFKAQWNVKESRWEVHDGVLTTFNKMFGLPGKRPPDARQLSDQLRKVITVSPIDAGPLYQISMNWPDPAFGKALLSSLIRGADDTLRNRRAVELRSREAYLTAKLNQTNAVEQRIALSQILGQTTLSQAVLYQTPHYSVDIVQPATASAAPVSPVPLLDLIFAAIGGAVLGCISIFAAALASGVHPADYGRDRRGNWFTAQAERLRLPV